VAGDQSLSYLAIKLSSYQAIKLSSYQAIKLSSYQATKQPNYLLHAQKHSLSTMADHLSKGVSGLSIHEALHEDQENNPGKLHNNSALPHTHAGAPYPDKRYNL
jgi:hypothetical protein